jgi:hypothetical protein
MLPCEPVYLADLSFTELTAEKHEPITRRGIKIINLARRRGSCALSCLGFSNPHVKRGTWPLNIIRC